MCIVAFLIQIAFAIKFNNVHNIVCTTYIVSTVIPWNVKSSTVSPFLCPMMTSLSTFEFQILSQSKSFYRGTKVDDESINQTFLSRAKNRSHPILTISYFYIVAIRKSFSLSESTLHYSIYLGRLYIGSIHCTR